MSLREGGGSGGALHGEQGAWMKLICCFGEWIISNGEQIKRFKHWLSVNASARV